MKHLSNFLFILSYLVYAIWPISSSAVNKEMVIAQMNSCVNTLTNIINNKSMTVLEHETDQLLNNLTIEQIIELYDIVEFRTNLIEAVGKLSITEEERSLLKRVNSIKRDNLKWQVFSNALNNTMLLTGGGNIGLQAGFQALVTAARSGVEYKTAQNNMEIEELQAMWELRKSDLNNFIELRKQALAIIFGLYKKYNLKEADRLTEKTSLQFQKIISDPDAKRMVRLLNDNYDKFGHLADFYYYLGMGYIDLKNVPKAMEAFSKYEEAYKKAPIYRINEKSGLISLTKLSYLNNISNIEIENELSNVIKNLPNNTMALIQSAIVYDKVLNNPRKALSILRGVLDNNETQDKTASIIAGSLILPKLSNQALEYKDFLAAYSNQNTIDLDAALNICIATKNNIFSFLEKIISISSLCHHPYIFSKAQLNDKIIIEYPKRYLIDLFHIRMYVEEKKGNEITVYQYKLADAKNIDIKKIEKVNAFKRYPNLKYLYLESAGDNLFQVKDNLDYTLIDNGNFPRQSEFELETKDQEEIIKFLKKNENKSEKKEIIAEKIETSDKSIIEQGLKMTFPIIYDGASLYKHFKNQSDATYIKIIFDDSRKIILCYKFDSDKEKLIPCYSQYQGKIYFTNTTFLQEFGYSTKEESTPNKTINKEQTKKEKSWWDKLWGSDDDKTDYTKKSEQKNAVKKDQPKKEVKKEQTKQDDKKEKSWWDKLWGSDDDKADDSKKADQKKQK